MAFDGGEGFGVDEFILERENVAERCQPQEVRGIVPIADECVMGEAAGGGMFLAFKNGHGDAKLGGGLGGHLGELPAADEAKREG